MGHLENKVFTGFLIRGSGLESVAATTTHSFTKSPKHPFDSLNKVRSRRAPGPKDDLLEGSRKIKKPKSSLAGELLSRSAV